MKRNPLCARLLLSSAICCSFLLPLPSYATTFAAPTPRDWVTVGEDGAMRASVDRNSIELRSGDARAFALRYYLLGGMDASDAFPENPMTYEALYSCNKRWRSVVYNKTTVRKNSITANAYSDAHSFAPGSLDDKIRQAVCK